MTEQSNNPKRIGEGTVTLPPVTETGRRVLIEALYVTTIHDEIDAQTRKAAKALVHYLMDEAEDDVQDNGQRGFAAMMDGSDVTMYPGHELGGDD